MTDREILLSEKRAMIGMMTAGLSHEIRNPLNAATLQLSLLARDIDRLPGDLQAPLISSLRLAREEMRRLAHLLEDFLLMATPRAPSLQSVDVGMLTQRVLDFVTTDAQHRGVRISRKFGTGHTAFADEQQIRQVVTNICLNAIEATPPHGSIDVTVTSDQYNVTLTIDDTGPGVPLEIRERIFEPFFTTKASGSGLGLSIAQSILAYHNGALSLHESAAGGARFVVMLPRPARSSAP